MFTIGFPPLPVEGLRLRVKAQLPDIVTRLGKKVRFHLIASGISASGLLIWNLPRLLIWPICHTVGQNSFTVGMLSGG